MTSYGTAESDSFLQGLVGIAGRDILVTDEAGVTDINEGLHGGAEVDFLRIVEFATTGSSGGVHVAEEMTVGADAANEVSIHDLRVVEIEE